MRMRFTKTTCALAAALVAGTLILAEPVVADPGRGWRGPWAETPYPRAWRGGPPTERRYDRGWGAGRYGAPSAHGWHSGYGPRWEGPARRGSGVGRPGWRSCHRRPYRVPPAPPRAGVSVILSGAW
jgi:hypothetical protein